MHPPPSPARRRRRSRARVRARAYGITAFAAFRRLVWLPSRAYARARGHVPVPTLPTSNRRQRSQVFPFACCRQRGRGSRATLSNSAFVTFAASTSFARNSLACGSLLQVKEDADDPRQREDQHRPQ